LVFFLEQCLKGNNKLFEILIEEILLFLDDAERGNKSLVIANCSLRLELLEML